MWNSETALNQAKELMTIAGALKKEMKGAEIPTAAFLLVDSEGSADVVLLPDLDVIPDKAMARAYIQMQASRFGAKFVAFVSEAWTVEAADPDEQTAVQVWTQSGRSLREYPGATEHVICSIDGPGLSRVLRARITADGLGDVEDSGEHVFGRMSNLSGRLGEN